MKLPNQRLTIAAREYALLKPGMDMLTNRLAGAREGSFPYQRASARYENDFTNIYKNREYDEEMARSLTRVRLKLGCTDSSRRIRLDEFEIAAAALALRLLKAPQKSELAEAQAHSRNQLSRKLEMYRKRAKVATIRKLGSEGRRALADRWSAFVAWMRYSLLQHKPIPTHISASATIKRAQRRDLTALLKDIVDKAYYEPLEAVTMKRVATLFLASARRGRQKLSLRELLKSPDKHRAKLLKFTMKRTTLVERADFPKPPGIRMMLRAEKFAEYEAAKKNGTWKKASTALPVGPPVMDETAAKAGPAVIRDASGSSQAGVKSEPWPHSPAWEDMLWNFLGEWFSRDVPLALREPIVHRVSWLVKFNGLAPFRYLKVSFTNFPTVFSACKPAEHISPLDWHVTWILQFLFALQRKPECLNNDVQMGATRALLADGIHNG